MVRAGKHLIIAGTKQEPSFDYKTGVAAPEPKDGFLAVYSTEDGKKISQVNITGYVLWDSIAVANGKIYATTSNGELICLK